MIGQVVQVVPRCCSSMVPMSGKMHVHGREFQNVQIWSVGHLVQSLDSRLSSFGQQSFVSSNDLLFPTVPVCLP